MLDEMLKVVKCPKCEKKEYYGMMHWVKGKTMCRVCLYDVWKDMTKGLWQPPEKGYTFPIYSDGKDYTKKKTLKLSPHSKMMEIDIEEREE